MGDILSYIQIRLDQRAPRDRAVEERRHGEPRLRPHVLQQGISALAGPQGEYQHFINPANFTFISQASFTISFRTPAAGMNQFAKGDQSYF